MTKEEAAIEKARIKAEKEAEKLRKAAEKAAMDRIISPSDFFISLYDHLSLALHTKVETVYIQTIDSNEKEIIVAYDSKDFPFCRCYLKIKQSFFEESEFTKWVFDSLGSFNIDIDTIDILRKFKRKPGKKLTYVPFDLNCNASELKIKYKETINENGDGEDREIYLYKTDKDYFNNLTELINKDFIDTPSDIPWMLSENICNIYMTEEQNFSKEKTNKKILEISKKDIYIELKDEDAHYEAYVTESDEKGHRWLMLKSSTSDSKITVGQIMKVISK